MTTQAAAALYLYNHLRAVHGKPVAVFNPRNVPLEELPTIFGFNNGGSPGWLDAILLAEDGTPLGSHICSEEGYMASDLGILEGTAPSRHDRFSEHYPDGYRMQFIGRAGVEACAPLMQAIRIAQAAHRATNKGEET